MTLFLLSAREIYILLNDDRNKGGDLMDVIMFGLGIALLVIAFGISKKK